MYISTKFLFFPSIKISLRTTHISSSQVHFSQLRMMNNEMISRFPMQAIECRLDVDVSFTCTAEVSDMFVNLVDGQCFKMTIKNVLPGKVLLVDLTDAEGISVADRLKETFTVKPTSPPVTPNAYAAPPKAQLQKSQSGNFCSKLSMVFVFRIVFIFFFSLGRVV